MKTDQAVRVGSMERGALVLGVLALLNYGLGQSVHYLDKGGWWIGLAVAVAVGNLGAAVLLARVWLRVRAATPPHPVSRGPWRRERRSAP